MGSSSTGSSGCDASGSRDTCSNCALGSACAPEANACSGDADCIAMLDCFETCVDDVCLDNCMNTHPTGAQLYMAMAECVFCGACVLDCNGGQQC
ncbi:MAG: hypothetical protein WKG00_20140 [Polyangiaceae bacterium]